MAPADPNAESARVAALHALQILDTPREERFDRIARLAAMVLDAPIALIGFLDEDRQWFKASHGIDISESPLEVSFCTGPVTDDAPLVVPDAHVDPRFAANPLVTDEPRLRFYAGHPVHAPRGEALGTICVFDREPRQPTAEQLAALRDLARIAELELGAARASEALLAQREEHEWLRAVLDASTDGVLAVGPDGGVGLVNATATRMLRLPDGRPMTRTVAELLGSDPPPGRSQVEVRRHDGTTFPALCHRTQVGGEGERLGELIAFGDLTDQLSLGRMQDDFIRLAAHELRTPLTSVLGFGELLAEEQAQFSERGRSAIDAVMRNARRLEVLVDDLLLVLRLESGHVGLHPDEVDVAQAAEEVTAGLASTAAAAEVAIAVEAGPARVHGDPHLVRRAIRAMVEHGLRESPPSTLLRVFVTQADGAAEVTVCDSGPGLPADELAAVARPFYRSATAGPLAGPGLDLTIARGVAEAHAGRFDVTSPDGDGLATTLRLPVTPRAAG